MVFPAAPAGLGGSDSNRSCRAWASPASRSSAVSPRSNSVRARFHTRNSSIWPWKQRATSLMLSPTRSLFGDGCIGVLFLVTDTGMPFKYSFSSPAVFTAARCCHLPATSWTGRVRIHWPPPAP